MTTLTNPQKAAIRSSWSKFMDNGVSNGQGFYMDLFKAHPETLTPFKSLFGGLTLAQLQDNPKMKAQSLVFCNGMSSFVDHLDDNMLVVLIQKMAKLHNNRGIRASDLRTAYDILIHYMEDHNHMVGGAKDAWEVFVGFICKTLGDYMKELS
uniref:Hemoglobin-2 n=1 Tax=Phacoides pectinatus TaxID=244486 RepID=GLB2_PHAPT|nr:RecName: Full=Hemoglobin-2; AltName: Full=Hemoglobin II; Short=Hb II; Short=HbII [Phacoides pectinatus]